MHDRVVHRPDRGLARLVGLDSTREEMKLARDIRSAALGALPVLGQRINRLDGWSTAAARGAMTEAPSG